MQGKTYWRTKVEIDDGQLEQLVERGRQLHDQMVFDLLAGVLSTPVRLAKQYFGNDRVNRERSNYSERLSLNRTPHAPA